MNQTESRRKKLMYLISLFGLIGFLLVSGLTKDLGMAYLAASLELFYFFYLLFLKQVPEYMEKMIRFRINKEQYKNAKKVTSTIMSYCILTGGIIAVVLFLLSDTIAFQLFGMEEMSMILKAMAPAFFFTAIGVALQGYFQGIGTAMPTLIYQVVKHVFIVSFSILFGWMLLGYGDKVSALLQNENFSRMYATLGIMLGITAASILADLFLVLIYMGAGKRAGIRKKEGMKLSESPVEVFIQFEKSSAPKAIVETLLRLPILIGLVFYCKTRTGGEAAYGAFYIQCLVISLSAVYGCRIFISSKESMMLSYIKKEEYKIAKNYLSAGLQSVIGFSGLLALLSSSLATTYLKLFFPQSAYTDQSCICMFIGFTGIVFLSLGLYFQSVLYGMGRKRNVLINVTVAFVIQCIFVILFSTFLTERIFAITVGFLILSFIFCVLNGFFVFRLLHFQPEWSRGVLLPMASCAITEVCLIMLNRGLVSLIGGPITLIICLLAGLLCYIVLLFVCKCIRERDLDSIPCGRFLGKVGTFLHLL